MLPSLFVRPELRYIFLTYKIVSCGLLHSFSTGEFLLFFLTYLTIVIARAIHSFHFFDFICLLSLCLRLCHGKKASDRREQNQESGEGGRGEAKSKGIGKTQRSWRGKRNLRNKFLLRECVIKKTSETEKSSTVVRSSRVGCELAFFSFFVG